MSKYIISEELGCVYRLNEGVIEYTPFYHDTPDGKNWLIDTEEFAPVEPELVGEELVKFRGLEVPLNSVYRWVENKLTGKGE